MKYFEKGFATKREVSDIVKAEIGDKVDDIVINIIDEQRNEPNGLAGLDANGKLAISQIPGGVQQLQSQSWDASTNTPNLLTIEKQAGFIWLVGTAGNTSLSGITDWQSGDYVIYLGSNTFGRIDNTDNTSLQILNNLSDLSNKTTARTNLDVYSTSQIDNFLNTKENNITAGTTSQYYRGDKTFQTLDKSAVGLNNVDNTSDINKPISTATQEALNSKEPVIELGTVSQYYRGDKTFQTLNKNAVGLENVDNTSDVNKPISTATQTALNLKSDKVIGATANNFASLDSTGNLIDSGKKSSDFEPADTTILKEEDVINNLTSTDTNKPLSANQGKTLQDNKADKVIGATNGNFASLNSSGNLVDSTKKASDFEPADINILKKSNVIDNLTSTNTDLPLSANQGKILQDNKVDKITGKGLSTNDFDNTYKAQLDNFTENSQDAVGGALTDTATIDLTYNDELNQITADVKDGSINNVKIGSNADISTFKIKQAIISPNNTIASNNDTQEQLNNKFQGQLNDKAPKIDGEPNGFIDASQISLSWSDVNRTLTITKTGSDFSFYANGVKFTKTADETMQIGNVIGNHFIYFDNDGVLKETTTFTEDLITRKCYVAFVYWTGTQSLPDCQIETHGCEWSSEIHLQQHLTIGTKYESGLALSLVADGDGSIDSHIQLIGASGIIWDEDIKHTIPNRLISDILPIIYRTGASNWNVDKTGSFLTKKGTNRAYYNQKVGSNYQLTELTNNNLAIAYIYTAPSITYKWFVVMGQEQYNNINDARAGAGKAPNLGGLPLQEFKLVGAVIYQTSDSYTNTAKARIISIDGVSSYVDWRQSTAISNNASITSSDVVFLQNQIDLKGNFSDTRQESTRFVEKTYGLDTNDGLTIFKAFKTAEKGWSDVNPSGQVKLLGGSEYIVNHTFNASKTSIKTILDNGVKISGTINLVSGNTSMQFFDGKISATINDNSSGTCYFNNVDLSSAVINFNNSGYKYIANSSSAPTLINFADLPNGTTATATLININGGAISIGSGWTIIKTNSTLAIVSKSASAVLYDSNYFVVNAVISNQTILNAVLSGGLAGLYAVNFASPTGITGISKGDIIYKVGASNVIVNKFFDAPSSISVANGSSFDTWIKQASDNWVLGSISSTNKLDATNIADGSISNTEFQALNNITGNIQSQLNNKLETSLKGAVNGLAELGSDGKVPSSQLPAYVDDVLEFDNFTSFPATGDVGKIYVAKDTNIIYRWSGSQYIEISSSLALGETSSTAYRGDRGKIAYDHSQITGNPHSTTKSDVGLSNVDNTSDVNKPISTATQNALDLKEPSITGGTTSQYYRGDKTFQTLDKSAVGLSNVDNTADVNKNVLSATKLTTARNINGVSFDGTANITIADDTKEPAFSKNTAFNKNFGNTSGTVTEGNDGRLGTKLIDEINIANNRIQVYNSTSGKLEYQDKPVGSTNLSIANKTGTTLDIASDTGNDATVPQATITEAGLLSASDKVKLNNTSGTNTGDQNLSGLMVKSQNLSDVANRQTSLNNLTNIATATNEYVLTKDTATGNAIFKPSVGGGSASTIATTATTGGTTTLTASSANIQRFTGTAGQILVLPDATTLTNAKSFDILNDCTTATGVISIRTNGGAYLTLVPQTGKATIILEDNGTTAGVWSVEVSVPNISGLTIINSANSFIAGQYLTNGASTYVLAQSNSQATLPCIARVISANANQYAIFTSGVCSTNLGLDSGLTANTSYIISNITAGAVIAYPATPSDGQLIQPVFEASSATSGVFNPLTVSTWNVSANPATFTTQGVAYLSNPIAIANNTTDADNDIDFTAGNFIFSDYSGQAVTTAMTKRLDAPWVAGTGNGGLDTGTKANSTWYYLYAIYNPTTQTSDFIFSASAVSPTLPSGFTKYSFLHCCRTNASGNIMTGVWVADKSFYYSNIMIELETFNTTLYENLLLQYVPPLIRCYGLLTAFVANLVVDSFPIMRLGSYINGNNANNVNFTLFVHTADSGASASSGKVLTSYGNIFIDFTGVAQRQGVVHAQGFQLI